MPPKVKFSKEQIVAAALDIAREQGIAALTARAVADKLNCSVAPVFSVFENMDELREEVIRQAKSVYDGYIEEGLKQVLPFKGVGLKYIEFAKREPNLFRVLFMSDYSFGLDKFMLLDKNNAAIVNALMNSWSVDKKTAVGLHQDIMIYTHGIAVMCATKSCNFSDEEISERLTFAFMSMLKQVKEVKNDKN
ncbi:MAG: TetR/AcrR family transcriptional regulator [Clostridia bacterium]|nr:TetR/AcrR family transcriptional regulator [Clostridia bacterium]